MDTDMLLQLFFKRAKQEDIMCHELIKVFIIPNQSLTHGGVLSHHMLRLSQLSVDPGQLVNRRGNPQASHVRRQQLLVQRVSQYLRLVLRILPITLRGSATPAIALVHVLLQIRRVDDRVRVDDLAVVALQQGGVLARQPLVVARRRRGGGGGGRRLRRRGGVGGGVEVEEAVIARRRRRRRRRVGAEEGGVEPAGSGGGVELVVDGGGGGGVRQLLLGRLLLRLVLVGGEVVQRGEVLVGEVVVEGHAGERRADEICW